MNPSFAASLPARQLNCIDLKNCSRPQTADESMESTIKGKSMQYEQLECTIKGKSVQYEVNMKYSKSEPIKLLKSSYSILWCIIILINVFSSDSLLLNI